MRDILGKIYVDIAQTQGKLPTDRHEKALKSCLTKEYPVHHAEKQYKLSFYDVASISRSGSEHLDLGKAHNRPYFSFFRSATVRNLPPEIELLSEAQNLVI